MNFFPSTRVRIDMVQDDFYLFVSLLALGLFEFCSNGSYVVVHVMLDSDAQLAALQTSGERN